jgi:hypothetical protein
MHFAQVVTIEAALKDESLLCSNLEFPARLNPPALADSCTVFAFFRRPHSNQLVFSRSLDASPRQHSRELALVPAPLLVPAPALQSLSVAGSPRSPVPLPQLAPALVPWPPLAPPIADVGAPLQHGQLSGP